MNLYLRFFNEEVLVETADQAIDFLSQIPEIHLDDALCQELRRYAESSNNFPKRFKVGPKVYFIVIKSTATTMEEFKAHAANAAATATEGKETVAEMEKEPAANSMEDEQPGWYLAKIQFKRVLSIEGTKKFQYVDTDFEAKLKAHSKVDCYNRLIDHLRNRADVDPRSQFPSIKGRKFSAEFLGME